MNHKIQSGYIPSIDTVIYCELGSIELAKKLFPSGWLAMFKHKFTESTDAIKHVLIFIESHDDPLRVYNKLVAIHGSEKTKMYIRNDTHREMVIPPGALIYAHYPKLRSRIVTHKNVFCPRCMMPGIVKTPIFNRNSGTITITYSCICHGACPIHPDTQVVNGCWRCKWKKCATPQCDRMLEKEGICNQCLILSRY